MGTAKKRISFDRLVSRSYWYWRRSPALTVPSMFGTGLSTLAEAIFGVAVLGLLVELEGTGWLGRIAGDLGASNFQDLGALLQSGPFITAVLEYLLPATAIAAVVLVLAGGFVYSAEYGSYWQARDGAQVGVADVMSRFVEKWRTMAWTVFLSELVSLAPLWAGFGLLLAASAGGSSALLFPALAVLAAGGAATAVLSLAFIYAPVVVFSEGLGGLAALRRSWHLVWANFRISLAYGLVYVFLTGALAEGAALVPFVSLPTASLVSVVVLIMVTPVLHMTKTEIYYEASKPEPMEFAVYGSFFGDLKAALPRELYRRLVIGLKELKAFALSSKNLPYHALSAAGLLVGWWLGGWVGNQGLVKAIFDMGYVPGKINPLVTGSPPLSVGVYIFFHNWQASLATALSGIWFPGVPFVTLVLNGVVIGVASDLAPNAAMLAAAILPHGIIELPSFVLAGSAGIKLGVVFLRSFGNPGPALQATARQTVYLLLGLAVLFFVAGFIEGNVTPWIMGMAGWS